MECNFENCGYYVDEECTICGMGTDGEDTFCKYCEDNPNCYYKQLKRLQQDYVNLSKSFEHLQSSYQENQEYGLQLKAENERLKEGIKEKESEIRQKKMTILMNNDHYLTVDENNRKYKQTLQEIKAIAKTGMHCEGMGCDFMPKILDLITKAEEE